MEKMEIYQKGIIAGGTGLLYQAADMLKKSGRAEKIELYFCNQNGFGKGETEFPCHQVSEKAELMDMLKQETEKTLVLSVMNPWLFPEEVLENSSLLVVNLHHALLPAHRGRNAEAWAIYEGDEKAGITWHKVDAGIDTGAVYLQKEVEIDSRMTSLKLLSKLNEAALEGLEELLQGDFKEHKADDSKGTGTGKPHLAKDIPNDGWLDLSWNPEQISRFLRAMDYGVINVFGKPRVRLPEGVHVWKAFKISEEEGPEETRYDETKRELCIRKDGKLITLKKMKKMEENNK